MAGDGEGADLSEVEGLTYACIDGCALCCLCQPELLPDEERAFRGDPALRGGVADQHISPDVQGAAIRLQGAHGACHFLRQRRCSIYQRRPHYCRAFPLSVFSGWRVQVNANLSCRGMGLPGEDLAASGRALLGGIGADEVAKELSSSREVFAEFSRNTRDAKVAQSVPSLRGAAAALMEDMTDEPGLARVLTYADSGRTRQNSSAQEIARRARDTHPEADVGELGVSIGTELFDLEDLSYLPIYVAEDLRWRIFQLQGDEVVGYLLDEGGGTQESSRTSPSEVAMLPMTPGGRKAFAAYLDVVNRRDCFVGHAAHLLDEDGYSFNFAQAYLGALANTAVDLWWRTSFLAHLEGAAQLDERRVREGVVFFDMDLLDQPTIGAFL
ncbi:MAG: YkgJ family cysteine cluster protein [Candidatus Thermoplasmatota archaeon]